MAKYPMTTDKDKMKEAFKGAGEMKPGGLVGAGQKAGAKLRSRFGESALGKMLSGAGLGKAAAGEKKPLVPAMAKHGLAPRTDRNRSGKYNAKGLAGAKAEFAKKAKPASGASSGSITKPSPSFKKSRDELGAFYLNATSGMDIQSRPGEKKKK